jgi:hypothetical protein
VRRLRRWLRYRRVLAGLGYARQSPYAYEADREDARRAAGWPDDPDLPEWQEADPDLTEDPGE